VDPATVVAVAVGVVVVVGVPGGAGSSMAKTDISIEILLKSLLVTLFKIHFLIRPLKPLPGYRQNDQVRHRGHVEKEDSHGRSIGNQQAAKECRVCHFKVLLWKVSRVPRRGETRPRKGEEMDPLRGASPVDPKQD